MDRNAELRNILIQAIDNSRVNCNDVSLSNGDAKKILNELIDYSCYKELVEKFIGRAKSHFT